MKRDSRANLNQTCLDHLNLMGSYPNPHVAGRIADCLMVIGAIENADQMPPREVELSFN